MVKMTCVFFKIILFKEKNINQYYQNK